MKFIRKYLLLLLALLQFGNANSQFIINPYIYSAPLLLDTYTGAKVAWSYYQLRTAQINSIRVRRSSDNTEQDVGFVANYLDTASLKTFCGVGDGFITTEYDQTGNGKDAVQAVAGNQPSILLSGVLNKLNGRVCAVFDGSNDRLLTATTVNGGTKPANYTNFNVGCFSDVTLDYNAFVVSSKNDATDQNTYNSLTTNAVNGGLYLSYGDGTNSKVNISALTVTSNTQFIISQTLVSPTTFNAYLNGGAALTLVTTGIGTGSSGTEYRTGIGSWGEYGSGLFLNGKFQEHIMFATDQSANRAAILLLLNTRYATY